MSLIRDWKTYFLAFTSNCTFIKYDLYEITRIYVKYRSRFTKNWAYLGKDFFLRHHSEVSQYHLVYNASYNTDSGIVNELRKVFALMAASRPLQEHILSSTRWQPFIHFLLYNRELNPIGYQDSCFQARESAFEACGR